jgi:hypothetical protein
MRSTHDASRRQPSERRQIILRESRGSDTPLDRAHEALSGGIGVECSELCRILRVPLRPDEPPQGSGYVSGLGLPFTCRRLEKRRHVELDRRVSADQDDVEAARETGRGDGRNSACATAPMNSLGVMPPTCATSASTVVTRRCQGVSRCHVATIGAMRGSNATARPAYSMMSACRRAHGAMRSR